MKILQEHVDKKSLVRGGRRALVDTDNLQPPDHPLPLSYHCLMVLRLRTALVKVICETLTQTSKDKQILFMNSEQYHIFCWIQTTYNRPTDRPIDHNPSHYESLIPLRAKLLGLSDTALWKLKDRNQNSKTKKFSHSVR